ncbi:Clathrin/coatomer adaptor, adaptin-like, N-terminal,Armadillo-type fold,Armadillo-like [Cinara cedri]|uniref:AP-3 complex subunit delta n=1 Tax=Cinara cedri TaxID=506608 RepID=A0A5E4MRC4_9HEMI|nr:Clathrin/coatomer adaptor, adaptin-like, N-terminal,Armadillo-type fold,Armadillo-like [Cinara cedri]
MALKKVRGNIERMFDKNLTDLVRGIRNSKENEAKYIAQCMEEIKQELRQENVAVKATAVAKLTYLQMLGYDISWAGFNIIEVMSSSKFTYKRIGYLASSQSFHTDTDLLMLTTNMIRKDLNSQNQYDAGVALSALACFISPDLARDLANDIMTLLSSTKPYLRKKAVLMMYKVFLRFPEALRPAFPRLKDKLEDMDCGVQSAAVNVVCELARKNPKNYLSLAPVFFKLMTSSTNNWMLIKIIKLFGALTPLEPRLGKKLIEPLTNLIHSTSAMSLLYECINTVIAVLISISSGMPNHSASIQLCVQKLRILIEDSDQNLKYLGLLAMSKILKTHPKSVQAHKDLIMVCLDDKDESIRLRALDLLYGMVSKKNLMEIVKKLMVHMDKAEGTVYRDELLVKIIDICSQDNYHFITSFEWYVSVLVELARVEGMKHGPLLAHQMLDVAVRVKAIRPFAVGQMTLLLNNSHMFMQPSGGSNMANVLYAAAWICGEYANELEKPEETLFSMLTGKVHSLPGHIQSAYVQNIMKVLSIILSKGNIQQSIKVCKRVSDKLVQYVSSGDLEVQERSSAALQLISYILKELENGDNDDVCTQLAYLFSGELNPVAPKAQRKVQVPEGLNLNQWINEPLQSSSESDDDNLSDGHSNFFNLGGFDKTEENENTPNTAEQVEKNRKARLQEQENNPNYLKLNSNNDQICDIPITSIDLPTSLNVSGFISSDKYIKTKKSKKDKKKSKKKKRGQNNFEDEEIVEPIIEMIVNRDIGEMPDGAEDSDGAIDVQKDMNDPHTALDIDLDVPEIERPPPVEEKKHKKKKKEKEKKKKTEKSKKLKKIDKNDQQLIEIKQGYEEALGICTPSKEIVQAEDLSFNKLAMDKFILLEYKIDPKSELSNLATVFFRFTNVGNNCLIKNIEIDVTNSAAIQFLDEKNQSLSWYKLSNNIQCGSSTELDLSLQVENITIPNTLRGTLTYMAQMFDEDNFHQDKLDWRLTVCVSDMFLKAAPSVPLVELLCNGQLVFKSSVILSGTNFNQVINWFSTKLHLVLVERVGETSSLYGSTASNEQLCLLVKSNANNVSVEAKCTSQALVDNLMSEIKSTYNI